MSPYSFGSFVQNALNALHPNENPQDKSASDLTQTQLYIGLNDMVTKEQTFDTSRYISLLKHVCVQYGTPFSFDVIEGGYIHDSGEYTEERTIVLTFIGVDHDTVDNIAHDLCAFFHQESVLVTTSNLQVRFVREPWSV